MTLTGGVCSMKPSSMIAGNTALSLLLGRQEKMSQRRLLGALLALAEAVDLCSESSSLHSPLSARISLEIGRVVGLAEKDLHNLYYAALLHDIGKIEISREIIQKPGPLSEDEWQIMRTHPGLGAQLLETFEGLEEVAGVVHMHHEKWDGSGYPRGLKGEEILLQARILALADAYSVMIVGRVYRAAFTRIQVIEELKRCSGTHFDPHLVECMLDLLEKGRF